MAAFVKYENFVKDLAEGVHDLSTAGSTLKVILSNTAPTPTTQTLRSEVTELTTANGYTSGGIDILNTGAEASGTYTVGFTTDPVWTATGGAMAAFRYVILYNDTPATPLDPLIGYWDYGSAVTLASGETFTVDFTTSVFTIA